MRPQATMAANTFTCSVLCAYAHACSSLEECAYLGKLGAKGVLQQGDCHKTPGDNGPNHIGAQKQGIVSIPEVESAHVDQGD